MCTTLSNPHFNPMKKHPYTLLAALLCSFLFTSCHNDSYDGGPLPPSDDSLAGSVTFTEHHISAEGSYDGIPLENLSTQSSIAATKASDTELTVRFQGNWDQHSFRVSVPSVPLGGKPYDVAFDYTCPAATVTHNGVEKTVELKITGWIKDGSRCDLSGKVGSSIPFLSPVPRLHDFDISFECLLDDRWLRFRVALEMN